ncbi:alpha-1,4-glucan--maltose-1-phosphate maltosyltransferase [Boudabousia tangfeifanii]|uniref:alpha-1,4-glucan--maltose-1-phosphate maltosyltransferase n=1 Tax=Boudabousia tangfeifanii TaxID=1912795 RepID=UPI0012EE417F
MFPEPTPISRIPVTEVFPQIEDGSWPAKAVEGEAFPVRATVFREGHDAFGVHAVLTNSAGEEKDRRKMVDIAPGLDRYETFLRADEPGAYYFHIEAFSDPYATWVHDASVKIAAGVDVDLMLAEGVALFDRVLAGEVKPYPPKSESAKYQLSASAREHLVQTRKQLADDSLAPQERLSAGLSGATRKVFSDYPFMDLVTKSRRFPVQVDRSRALTGNWYEVFPRSFGAHRDEQGAWVSGNFRGLIPALDRIEQMGFDVLYLTPVHPIGTTFRKGKNNSLEASATDPGSPYGIGSPEGGHDAIHPDLGTFDDFDALVAAAKAHGMEVALDLALQCSPDHPWVKEHPQWFSQRVDGTIAYAENPPKKYQDIYPLNFDQDPEGIYQAILAVILKWIEHGVTIFRVDNPHTKPLIFWQRLLREVRQSHPEVLFLAEAFTRPAMMRTLGAVGFHQSYTYFAWRTGKQEILDYFWEVSHETDHLMRPSFWPTTHDILTPQMTAGGRNMFAIRAVLAATGAPTWGIYSGYELVESEPRPGFEEQNDNEKYEYRPRDFAAGDHFGIADLLTKLNQAKAEHAALRQLRGFVALPSTSDDLVAFLKYVPATLSADGQSDAVIVVVNLDPQNVKEGMVGVDLSKLGVDTSQGTYQVRDLLDGHEYTWGSENYVRLDPNERVAHVFSVLPK